LQQKASGFKNIVQQGRVARDPLAYDGTPALYRWHLCEFKGLLRIVKGRLVRAKRRFRGLDSFVRRILVLPIQLREALIFEA
jgi:hypothetical protein